MEARLEKWVQERDAFKNLCPVVEGAGLTFESVLALKTSSWKNANRSGTCGPCVWRLVPQGLLVFLKSSSHLEQTQDGSLGGPSNSLRLQLRAPALAAGSGGAWTHREPNQANSASWMVLG